MARPRKPFPPEPKAHRGEMRTWWAGKWHHLGSVSDPSSWQAEYERLKELWRVDPYALSRQHGDVSVAELCRDYLASDDYPPARRKQIFWVVSLLLESHRRTLVSDFGPRALSAWRADLGRQTVGDGKDKRHRYSRSTIVRWVAIVRRIWRWGVATERIPETRYRALLTVPGPSRTEGRPPRRVKPANVEHVRACLPYLRGPVRAMVELQLLTGMRPSELFRMTPAQVHRSGVVDVPDVGEVRLGDVWLYVPEEAKTAVRWIVLGPKAQAILRPFLDRADDAPCFDPREAVRERNELAKLRRKNPRQKRPAGPGSRAGRQYTRQAYYQAVVRAAEKAGVPDWSPYQIRHRYARDVDTLHGREHAQAAMGHERITTTGIYARRNFAKAVEVAKAVG